MYIQESNFSEIYFSVMGDPLLPLKSFYSERPLFALTYFDFYGAHLSSGLTQTSK